MARHGFQHDGAIAHIARDGAGLIKRRGEGDDAPARATAIGGLDARRAGESRRLADGAARIRCRCRCTQMRRRGRGRAAGRAAGHQRRIGIAAPPRVDHIAVVARLVGGTHGELIHVELAQHHGAIAPELRCHRRVIGRLETIEHVAAGLRVHALCRVEILDAERNALERSRLALGDARVRCLGHGAGLFGCLHDIGIEHAGALHGGEIGVSQFECRKFFLREALARPGDGERGECHHSTTFGTMKK